MTATNMRAILAQMDKDITTQAKATTVQAQAMTAQDKRDVASRPHQQGTTMASGLTDITQMNPPTFMGVRLMKTLKNSSMWFKI